MKASAYRFCLSIIFCLAIAPTLTFAQFKLSMQFTDMEPHLGQKFELRVIDQANDNEVARTKVDPIASAAFNITLYALLQEHNYTIDFYADHNGSGGYDNADHSWRLQISNVQADTTLAFSHNTAFTNIIWPPLIDFNFYKAVWQGNRTNFTFSSGGPFEMMIDISVQEGQVEGSIDATDAFGISGTTSLAFEGEFFPEADSAVIMPTAESNWTGSLFWVNSQISGAFTYGHSGATVSLFGTLGRTQAIVEYDIDIFNAEGIIVAMEDSVITTIRQDSLALVALYDATDGDNWADNSNWKSGPVATWYGVSVQNNRVTQLQLGGNNLNGSIPDAICDLTELTILQLENNALMGTIPAQIGNLTKLGSLRLEQNNLTGPIPGTIGDLENLSILWLFSNELTGQIPAVIGNLQFLTQLNLSDNILEGELPEDFWLLTNLIEIRLRGNNLSGTLPAAIGGFTKLKRLILTGNNFSGTIPPEISMTSLFDLSIGNNNFEGKLPQELTGLTDMVYFYIYGNNFGGAVPEDVSAFNGLQACWVYGNNLTDFPDLSGAASLTDLRVQDNRFTFEDIEPNIGIATFVYTPQDSVGAGGDTSVVQSEPLTLNISVGGTANEYQWFKDGNEISGAVGSELIFTSVDIDDTGDYFCRITNTIVTQLTLYSRPFHVQVDFADHVAEAVTPQNYNLYANYPNPFNPETIIRYDLAGTEHVKVEIFNLLGQKIAALVNDRQQAGSYTITWNGQTERGFEAPSGTYIYRIKAGQFEQCRKLVLLR